MAEPEPAFSYDSFVAQILRPKNLRSLFEPYFVAGENEDTHERLKIRVNLIATDGDDEPEVLTFTDIFPFQTIEDLETAIYHAKDQAEAYHPQNLCLLEVQPDGRYRHLQSFHSRTTATGHVEELFLNDPFTQLGDAPDTRFVDLAGNRLASVSTVNRQQYLLETVLLQPGQMEYDVHCFRYTDLLEAFPGEREPISAAEWQGKFALYFPNFPLTQQDGSIEESADAYAPTRVQRFLSRQSMLKALNTILESQEPGEFRIPGTTMRTGDAGKLGSFKSIRIAWTPAATTEDYESFRVESVFYEMSVSEDVPYMRFYPKNSTPLSKIHVTGPLNIPSLERPEILLDWAGKKTKTLTPDEDMLMVKIRLRGAEGSATPLYATLFIFEDASAKLVVQPNTDMKKLNRLDPALSNLGNVLATVMRTLPRLQPRSGTGKEPLVLFPVEHAQLEDCYAVFELFLEREDTLRLSRKYVDKMLRYFRPVFQDTDSPIKEQDPVAFFRYKLQDNFRIASRDFQFLWRVKDLYMSTMEDPAEFGPALKLAYEKEYNVPSDIADKRLREFLSGNFQFEKTFKYTSVQIRSKSNPGVDIAVFGKWPYYYFHLYRVDDLLTLRRIVTFLTLFLSVTPDQFPAGSISSALVVSAEDKEKEADADVGALAAAAAAAAPAAPAAPVAEEEEEEGAAPAAWEADNLGLNLGLEEGEEAGAGAGSGGTPGGAGGGPGPLALAAAAAEDAGDEEGGVEVDEEEGEGDEDILDKSQLKATPAKVYFRRRLYFYDKQLFHWPKKSADGKKVKQYPSMCAANAGKQPVVMNQEEFAIMKDRYAIDEENGRVLWQELPIPKGVKPLKPANKSTEVIPVLQYGTTEKNYYICSLYWCRQDSVVVLKDDFEKAWDYRAPGSAPPTFNTAKLKRKDANTCPWCGGGLVTNPKVYIKGESVIERAMRTKKGDGKSHVFVGFLHRQKNPSGFYLPCCFKTEQKVFEDKHEAFKGRAPAAQRVIPAEPVVERLAEEDEEDELGAAAAGDPVIAAILRQEEGGAVAGSADYSKKLKGVRESYILGAEKIPLDIQRSEPQVGICPGPVDRFFSQKSIPNLVVHDHTVWKLMRNRDNQVNVSGFFRIAAENRPSFTADSFFAAVAPYYGFRSAVELKTRVKDLIREPLFLSLNYGNLLLDFYNPATPMPGKLPEQERELRELAKSLKLTTGTGKHRQALVRAWKGHTAFTTHMKSGDRSALKEYRHFAQFFSLRGLLSWSDAEGVPRSGGIVFLVLELDAKGVVTMRCPPYGVTMETAERPDVGFAFLLHYVDKGIWEPIFYTENRPSADVSRTLMVFSQDAAAGWPEVVTQRVAEFKRMCYSSGIGVYTDTYSVTGEPIEKRLLPLTAAMEMSVEGEDPVEIHAILRDTYNHVSAVLYRFYDEIVVVPVIDDGSVWPSVTIEIDWKNIMSRLATVEVTTLYYETYVYPTIEKLPADQRALIRSSYTISGQVRQDKTVPVPLQVYALKLGEDDDFQGLYVPVKQDKEAPGDWEPIQELPWMVDTAIVFGEQTSLTSFTLDVKDLDEVYQHLRFTFSNWLSVHPTVKEEMEAILFDAENGHLPNRKLSIWQKREALDVKLGAMILGWMDSNLPQVGRRPSLKRIDCTVQKRKENCDNRCVWSEEKGECLLHVPETYPVGAKRVDAKRLLMRRLFEELIQFPVKRLELLENEVYRYIKIRERTQLGSTVFYPEDTPAWNELLKFSWRQRTVEEAKYVEEKQGIQSLSEEEWEALREGVVPPPDEEAPAAALAAPAASDSDEEEEDEEAAAFGEEENDGVAPPPSDSDDEEEVAAAAGASEEEEEAPPDDDLPAFVKEFFNNRPELFWWPAARVEAKYELSPIDFLSGLVEKEEIGQEIDDDVVSNLEVAKSIAKSWDSSLFQVIWPDSMIPSILAVKGKLADDPKTVGFYVLLKLPDGTVGFLSSSNDEVEQVPVGILSSGSKMLKDALKAAPSVYVLQSRA